MTEDKHHIVPYRTYIFILIGLLTLTAISVAVTQIDLGTLTVMVALTLAAVKSTLVLIYFMHLKFEERIYAIMVAGVFLLLFIVFIITFLDYFFR
jgi:cytochrome c oxidase subunit 4